MDTWILGEAFMQNFYVGYDASDPYQLKVGLSQELPPAPLSSHTLEFIGIIIVIMLMAVFVCLAAWCCVKARRERLKNEKLEFYQA